MTVKDFMLAHEGEAGMAEKLTPEYLASQGVQLSEEKLETANGGGRFPMGGSGLLEVFDRDPKGRPTHWMMRLTGQIFYYACPKCKRVTYQGEGGFLYCDPCNTYWSASRENRVFI